MAQTVEIKGERELQRIFRILPQKVSRQLQLKALRMGAKPLVKAARAEAPKHTRVLSKSVGVVNDKNRNGAAIWVGIRIGRRTKFDGWYAWFVHHGTRGVGKRNKRSMGTTYSKSGAAGNSGIKPNPFFQRAWDQTHPAVLSSIGESLSQVVTKFLREAKPNYK